MSDSANSNSIGAEVTKLLKGVTPPVKEEDLEALAVNLFDLFAMALLERQRLWGDPTEEGFGLFAGRGQSPDLRHNAFGLFCGLLDDYLRKRYKVHDREASRGRGILAGRTELKPDKFHHIFTGYEVKRQGETLYSYRQMVGTDETEMGPLERNAGFLRRFLFFTLLAQAAEPDRAARADLLQSGTYSLAYLWALDAIANPRATLWAVQHAGDWLNKQPSVLIGEVGKGLQSLLGEFLSQSGAEWNWLENEGNVPGPRSVMPDELFEILAFSLAKCVYDGNALAEEAPVFLTRPPDDFSAAPILNFTEDDDPAKTLWTQFNRIVFLEMPYRQREVVRVGPGTPTEADVLRTDGQSRSAADDLPYIYLRQSMDRWTTVGLRGNTPFNDLQVSYARVNLPDFNYRWTTSNLKHLCEKFEEFVRVDDSSSHLVFLVGPFGTGKTTIAQVMTQYLTDQSDWFILAYHPETALFGFDWLTKEDTAETFRRNEISRLMMGMKDDIFGRIRYELPFDRRIIVNLSELNAADPDQIVKVQLPLIENLLREIKEKLLPRELVFFVSLQMYQLASKLQRFFERKPDLAMGRARVDTAWLVRGDCYQYLNRDRRTSFKEQYLARFAAYFAGGPSHLTRRAVNNALMNLETKARSSLIKVAAIETALKQNQGTGAGSRVLEIFGLMRELSIPEPEDYLAAWGHTEAFRQAFRLGFGNYTTTTISLANGFIRQTIDIIKNEFELLLKEWEVIEEISQKPHRDAAKRLENLARSELVDLLASVQTSWANFYYLVDGEVWDRLGKQPEAVARRLSDYLDLYQSAFDNSITVTGRVFTGQESGQFDIGFVLESRDHRSRLHFLVDLTKNVAGRDDKGAPTTPRVMLTWRNSVHDDKGEPVGISLGQFLAALGRLSHELLDEEKGVQCVIPTATGQAGVVRVDCQINDALEVPSFALTAFLKGGVSPDDVRSFAAELITELARLEKLYDDDVDFRPFDWAGKLYVNGKDGTDLHVADEAVHSYLVDRWMRALHLMRLYLPGFGHKHYLRSSPSVKASEQLYLLTSETLVTAGVANETDQKRILATAGEWVTDFVRNNRVDGVPVYELFDSLPLKELNPAVSVETWNDALRLAYFLYANCLVDAPNREWLVQPEGAVDVAAQRCLKVESLLDWLSTKWWEPEGQAVPRRVKERCEKLTARYG